jgi:hypothetical protein
VRIDSAIEFDFPEVISGEEAVILFLLFEPCEDAGGGEGEEVYLLSA